MRHAIHTTAVIASLLTASASADIVGFNGLHPSLWDYNQADSGTNADMPNPELLRLTNQGSQQIRSVFYRTRQDVTAFTASFTYRASLSNNVSAGACIVLHNDSRGAAAISDSSFGLGYAGIGNSVAIVLDLVDDRTGVMTGGVMGNTNALGTIDLASGHDIAVTLSYSDGFLTQQMVDTVTGASFTRNYIGLDLTGFLGGNQAFVGFGAATGTWTSADQYFSDFRFTSVPAPATGGLLAAGLLASARRRR